jgi:hypothetical protein
MYYYLLATNLRVPKGGLGLGFVCVRDGSDCCCCCGGVFVCFVEL